MCRYSFEQTIPNHEGGFTPRSLSFVSFFDALIDQIKLVGYGVDTLVVNVRYVNETLQHVQKELDETLQQELNSLQSKARDAETPIASDWDFQGCTLFMEPYGAGRQWRWRLTCRFLSLVISRGMFNNVIAQVRFSSEFLWREQWTGNALSKMHDFLMSIFGQEINLQVSSVDLCADIMGYDFSLANYQQDFISKARKQSVVYGPDEVNLESRTPSYLRFSSSASPISCRIYDKIQEIEQKSHKTWFYDLWEKGTSGPYGGCYDRSPDAKVWRVEYHFTREFFRNLEHPIESAYDLLDQFRSLWTYAVGQIEGDADGLPDGWLRYVVPTDDSNRSRWPLHPAWVVVQSAFVEPVEPDLGPVIRKRIRQKNLERGLAAIIGYSSTLAAWLGGDHAAPDTDLSLTLQWLYEHGQKYLAEKDRDFFKEVLRKQQLYSSSEDQQ